MCIRDSPPSVLTRSGSWSSFVGKGLDLLGVASGRAIFSVFSLVFWNDAGDGCYDISFVQIDELHPLSDTPSHPDLGDGGTDDYTMLCDNHDLVRRQNLHQ